MEIKITINTDRAEDVNVKVENNARNEPNYTPYARFFDINNRKWRADLDLNIAFLIRTQHYFNDKLRLEKKVYINDVYEALGFPRVKEYENLVGWTYGLGNPASDEYIDFGLYDIFKQPYWWWDCKRQILIDFNAEGDISWF